MYSNEKRTSLLIEDNLRVRLGFFAEVSLLHNWKDEIIQDNNEYVEMENTLA